LRERALADRWSAGDRREERDRGERDSAVGGAGGGDGAYGGAGGDDDRGGAADGHAAARADETAAALVMEATVQVCLDEDEDCFTSRAHRHLYRGGPFSTGPWLEPVLKGPFNTGWCYAPVLNPFNTGA